MPIKEFNGFKINEQIKDKVTGKHYLIFDFSIKNDEIDGVWIDQVGDINILRRNFDQIEKLYV